MSVPGPTSLPHPAPPRHRRVPRRRLVGHHRRWPGRQGRWNDQQLRRPDGWGCGGTYAAGPAVRGAVAGRAQRPRRAGGRMAGRRAARPRPIRRGRGLPATHAGERGCGPGRHRAWGTRHLLLQFRGDPEDPRRPAGGAGEHGAGHRDRAKHFAPDHPTFATRCSNLATIQQDQGDLPAARASMERAIAIDEKHFAPDHPDLRDPLQQPGDICLAEGDRAAACANLKRLSSSSSRTLARTTPT